MPNVSAVVTEVRSGWRKPSRPRLFYLDPLEPERDNPPALRWSYMHAYLPPVAVLEARVGESLQDRDILLQGSQEAPRLLRGFGRGRVGPRLHYLYQGFQSERKIEEVGENK